ncbi:sugar ABC transporter permease [Tessaracoccus sp. ZS01]|nr:sugar ABC transporter permease [Tessaracoccus sp. ZS01]OMG59075.1 sugar ABC transporter [Tessaracoccus sp. ZS01]
MADIRPRRRGAAMGSKWTPYFFLLPAAAYIFIFQAIPLAQQVYLSFTRTSLLNPSGGTWVGLDNYARIFGSPDFQKTLWTTLVYVVACVVGTVGLGFAVALLLNAKLPGRGIARAVVTIPWAAPGIATALIATWMMNPQYGIVTRALRAVGVDVGPSGVLDNPQLALPAILATTMWQLFPFVAVVILSALQAVPVELKEAAQLDRANRWWVFRVVTWQVVKPTVGLVALLMTIWSLRRFELIWLMTRGGPLGSTRTLVIDLYSKAFDAQRLGDAAAIGMVGIAMALIVVVGSRAVSRAAERGASS